MPKSKPAAAGRAKAAPAKKPAAKKVPAKKVPAKKAPAKKAAAPKAHGLRSRFKPENAARLATWEYWRDRPGAIDELCQWIAEGDATHSLLAWCKARNWNWTTVAKWIDADLGRQSLYEKARQNRGDVVFEQILTVSNEPVPVAPMSGSIDSAAVMDKRLRVDTLKWMAGRLSPKYRDKVAVGGDADAPPIQHSISGEVTMTPNEAYMRMLGKA